uniref:chitinase n=1 Tax=Leersia perrieri TaxID=77586 RepID=A0A0D9XM15_9ORYZ
MTTAMFARAVACAAALVLGVAASGAAAQGGVGSVITRSVFNSMLPNRDNSLCPARGFYTYDAFIAAAKTFPAFGTSGGSAELNRREIAAFFGQTSHETTGGTRGAADQFQWGYCFKEERNKATRSNYQLAGNALKLNLVGNPDLVSTNAVVSFRTAIWFWMTAQGNKPSSHDVIIGRWRPTAADTAAGRVPGYGVITNIINGGIECGVGRNDANVDRIGYYRRYCSLLGAGTGNNLDCYTQRNFAS